MAFREADPVRGDEYNRVKRGPETWNDLPSTLLNKDEKVIVSRDPNLSPSTMDHLVDLRQGKMGKQRFYFGVDDDYDVGLCSVSMCINDNPRATIAEVVARYSEMRGIPFLETAIALLALRDTAGLYRYIADEDKVPVAIPWTPSDCSVIGAQPPPKRHKIPV